MVKDFTTKDDVVELLTKFQLSNYEMGVNEGLRQAWVMINERVLKYGSVEKQGRRDGMIEACNLIKDRMPYDEDR